MKPGTHITLSDGRDATIVYNSLDGYGIRWGHIQLSEVEIEAIYSGNGNTFSGGNPTVLDIEPEAMLRDQYASASLPCVGSEFDVVETNI